MLRRRVVIALIATAIATLSLFTTTHALAAPAANSGRQAAPDVSPTPCPAVVAIAQSCLGVPYVYGGSSPADGFDCSGLTMYCFARVGVSLPHNAATQYERGAAVARADLQPGDLVFFGDPVHHVGIYVGGGIMIHAPYTGAVVRYEALLSDYVGARRLPIPPRTGDRAARKALRQLLVPYADNGADPRTGFDDPGLVRYVFLQCGKRLPKTIDRQFARGRAVEWDELKPGDLVFFGRPLKRVGVCVGNYRVVTVTARAGEVDVRRIRKAVFRGGRRVLPAPPGTTPTGRYVEIVARRYLGVPYLWAGATPAGFDCSGLTMYVLGKLGVPVLHNTAEQYGSPRGAPVERDDLRGGDLVFFGDPINHVGIYVGKGGMIDAPPAGGVVSVNPLGGDYTGARRFFIPSY